MNKLPTTKSIRVILVFNIVMAGFLLLSILVQVAGRSHEPNAVDGTEIIFATAIFAPFIAANIHAWRKLNLLRSASKDPIRETT